MYQTYQNLSAYYSQEHFKTIETILQELKEVRQPALSMFGSKKGGYYTTFENVIRDLNISAFSANKDHLKVYCYDLSIIIAKLDLLHKVCTIGSVKDSTKVYQSIYSAFVKLKEIRYHLFDII